MPISLWRRFGKIGAALVFVMVLANPYVWGSLSAGLQYVIKPVGQIWQKGVNWLVVFGRAHQLDRENSQLMNQLADLFYNQANQQQLEQDNKELKALLSLPVSLDWQAQAVEVIGKQNDESGVLYLINAGQNQGLEPGLAVVAGLESKQDQPSGLLVGTIKSVNSQTAGFILTTSPNSRLVAQILNVGRTQGLATGEYNLGLRIRYIPQDQPVTVGELAVTGNADPQLPSGLLLGVVSSIEANDSSFFKTAVVTPPIKLDKFKYLYVLKKP
ncbi:MAG: rod shape-determining protein MreC [Patescibacteria group bacterium]